MSTLLLVKIHEYYTSPIEREREWDRKGDKQRGGKDRSVPGDCTDRTRESVVPSIEKDLVRKVL